MANLVLTPEWVEGIYQLETSDPVMGGADGIDNRQAIQLGKRTEYLKQEVEKRAPLASPVFTGTPTAPTATQGTNNQQIATTGFVNSAIAALVGSAPATLDTLAEIATALGSDGNLKQTLLTEIGKKLNITGGRLTGNIEIDSPQPIVNLYKGGELIGAVGARNTSTKDLVFIKYNGNKNGTAINFTEDSIISSKPIYEGSLKLNSVSVIKGIIANGGTLPLPSGYTEAECSWIVSMKEDVALSRMNASNQYYTRTECYVDSNRKVVARVFSQSGANTDSVTSFKYDNSYANYLVIGVK